MAPATADPATLGAPLRAAEEPALARARAALLARQHAEGCWVGELEADAGLTAEYLLLRHFLGAVRQAQERKGARFLLER